MVPGDCLKKRVEGLYYAGTGSGVVIKLLVYPAGESRRAGRAGKRVCGRRKIQRSAGMADFVPACAEKLYAAAFDAAGNFFCGNAGRHHHCGKYFFPAGTGKDGHGCDFGERLSGHSGVCGMACADFSGDQFPDRFVLWMD